MQSMKYLAIASLKQKKYIKNKKTPLYTVRIAMI